MPRYPSRIVCLTEETTETLYLLGAGDRVVGVSGYTARPPEARAKPKVSAFINARFDKIAALEPDLIFAFSDLQADIVAELVRRGYPVFTFNQRTIAGILTMVRVVGGIIGCEARADALASSLEAGLEAIRSSAARFPGRPRLFFEEWDNPLISGIAWVEELAELAGATSCFPELRAASLARDRIVAPAAAAARDPEIVVASWCGKAVRKRTIYEREGWSEVSAIRHRLVFEVKSTYILQPGPAALTEGVRQLHALIARAMDRDVPAALAPEKPLDADAQTPVDSASTAARPSAGRPAEDGPNSARAQRAAASRAEGARRQISCDDGGSG